MNHAMGTSCRHLVELRPGEQREIELRFTEPRATFSIGLAEVNPSARTANLVFDDLWGAYHMRQFRNDGGGWTNLWPDDDGDIHCIVRFGPGKHVNISSDTAMIHSLDLIEVSWRDGKLYLLFDELG
jgi:hypothetical protein